MCGGVRIVHRVTVAVVFFVFHLCSCYETSALSEFRQDAAPKSMTRPWSSDVHASKKQDSAAQPAPNAKCSELLELHRKWLHGLYSVVGTSLTAERLSGIQHDPGSNSEVKGVITITLSDGTKREFRVFPSEGTPLSDIGRRWETFRKEAGLREGRRAHANAWLEVNDTDQCNWTGAFLPFANFDAIAIVESDFSKAILTGSLMRHAKVAARWSDAVLTGVDFSDSTFWPQNVFSRADLRGARLTNVVFTQGVVLQGANLSFADLTGAFFEPSDVS